MAKNWYVRVGDESIGPYTTGQVIDAIEAGEIQLGHLARQDSAQTWREVGLIQSFAKVEVGEESKPLSPRRMRPWKTLLLIACGVAVVAGGLAALAKELVGGPICEFDADGDRQWGTYEATSCSDDVIRRITCEIAPDQPGFDCVCASVSDDDHVVATPVHVHMDAVPRFALAWVQNNQLMFDPDGWPDFYSRTCPDHDSFQGLRAAE